MIGDPLQIFTDGSLALARPATPPLDRRGLRVDVFVEIVGLRFFVAHLVVDNEVVFVVEVTKLFSVILLRFDGVWKP
jgi:hypothetical protein